jgi:hypothetical protein
MKIFIAFMLVFFTNCLAPAAISATVNAKNGISNSPIFANGKLDFKEKSTLKFSKKKLAKLKKIGRYIVFSIILIVFGILLLIVAKKKMSASSANSSSNTYNLPDLSDGKVERFLGGLSIFVGILILIVKSNKSVSELKVEPASK